MACIMPDASLLKDSRDISSARSRSMSSEHLIELVLGPISKSSEIATVEFIFNFDALGLNELEEA